jgi:hypothetical protein
MKKVLTISIFMLSLNCLTAQIDSTLKDFYPLHIGNMWQYKNNFGDLLTTIIGSDTLLDGNLYYAYKRVGLRSQGGLATRVDSLMRIQNRRGGPTAGDSCGGNTPYETSIYHLDEPDSTVWEICGGFSGHLGDQLVRFNRIYLQNIFGQTREVMEFDYGGKVIGEDTVWSLGAKLVKVIGILEERYFNGETLYLQGAIINGVQYGTVVSVDESIETIPNKFTLYQNYPNPFNPTTTIRYEVAKTSYVKLKVINILGKEIAVLVNESKLPGSYEIEFNANSVNRRISSGVYFAVLQTNRAQLVRRMLLIK